MKQSDSASAEADRAVVNGAASVSAVPASVPSALDEPQARAERIANRMGATFMPRVEASDA